MSLKALQCKQCGGQITMKAGVSIPTCPFCDTPQLSVLSLEEDIVHPKKMIDFAIDEQKADESFRTFAASSWWYPAEIKKARLELRKIMIPAWMWYVELETHYAGLRSARTESGYIPFEGVEKLRIQQVLTPSSKGVSIHELNAIGPFESEQSHAFDPDSIVVPYELAELTQDAALQSAMKEAQRLHQLRLKKQYQAKNINVSCLFHTMEGTPTLLPVYIGVFRQNNYPYRIVINGINGKLIGKAPTDIRKILLIAGIVLGLFFMFLVCSGGIKACTPVI